MKKKLTNLAIILLLFVLVLIVFKVNRIKLYRSNGNLVFVKTQRADSIYSDGTKVLVRDKFGNQFVTNIFCYNGDGTYLTKRDDSHYMDNLKSDKNNILGTYSFQLKYFFSFFESKITRFIFLLIAIAIVLKIRTIYLRKQEKIKRVKTYNQDTTKEPL